MQSEVSGRKENEKITRAVQSAAGGRKENEKITRAVQSRAQECPAALSVRLLLRFLARFLTRVFGQGCRDRKYSVQHYRDGEIQCTVLPGRKKGGNNQVLKIPYY